MIRRSPIEVGRYTLFGEIACGGMAMVHHGLLRGQSGFTRTVAVKRLHDQYARDRDFVAMLLDEARVTGRIRHPHVVPMLDVVEAADETLLVMEYIHGESLSRLMRINAGLGKPIPTDVVSAVICGGLHGLHAAHDAQAEDATPLCIVHRDVSPQNIMVGADGIPRVLDFGIAKAMGRSQTTRDGELKGKVSYMAPEQLLGKPVDRRTDVYAMGVVLWEALTCMKLFTGDSEGHVLSNVLHDVVEPPSKYAAHLSPEIDAIVLRAVQRDATLRFQSARDMALALEAAVPIASPTKVAAWVESLVGDALAQRANDVARAERDLESGVVKARPLGEGSRLAKANAEVDRTDTSLSTEAPQADRSGLGRKPRPKTMAVGVAVAVFASLVAVGAVAARRSHHSAPEPVATSAPAASVPAAASVPPAPSVDSPPSAAAAVPPPPVVSPPPPPSAAVTMHHRATRPAVRATERQPGPAAPPPAPSSSAPSSAAPDRPRCDWRFEGGVWVPGNCR